MVNTRGKKSTKEENLDLKLTRGTRDNNHCLGIGRGETTEA